MFLARVWIGFTLTMSTRWIDFFQLLSSLDLRCRAEIRGVKFARNNLDARPLQANKTYFQYSVQHSINPLSVVLHSRQTRSEAPIAFVSIAPLCGLQLPIASKSNGAMCNKKCNKKCSKKRSKNGTVLHPLHDEGRLLD